jgi:hypothetical protein
VKLVPSTVLIEVVCPRPGVTRLRSLRPGHDLSRDRWRGALLASPADEGFRSCPRPRWQIEAIPAHDVRGAPGPSGTGWARRLLLRVGVRRFIGDQPDADRALDGSARATGDKGDRQAGSTMWAEVPCANLANGGKSAKEAPTLRTWDNTAPTVTEDKVLDKGGRL